MIQGVDNISDIFTHIAVDVPFSFQQLGSLINQVGGQHLVYNAVFRCLVKLVQTVCKQPKG